MIKLIKLSNDSFADYAVRISDWSHYSNEKSFPLWVEERELKGLVRLGTYYEPELMADIFYPCIKFAKGVDHSIINMVCLAWSDNIWQS